MAVRLLNLFPSFGGGGMISCVGHAIPKDSPKQAFLKRGHVKNSILVLTYQLNKD